MNIDIKSVIKVSGLTAFVGLVVGLLSTIPFHRTIGTGAGPDPIGIVLGVTATIPSLGCILMPLLCISFALVPTGAGLGYGYLAQGKGNLVWGGALTGALGGFLYGVGAGLISLAGNIGAAAFLQDVQVIARYGNTSIIGAAMSLCAATVIGLIFGAIGGALWPIFKRRNANLS
ncbi:MAG: hypothetical protein ABI947_06350 [Chloroflexota bacterium]